MFQRSLVDRRRVWSWILIAYVTALYTIFVVIIPALNHRIKTPPQNHIIEFTMPRSNLHWSVMSNATGVLNFKPSYRQRYNVSRWYLDGAHKIQYVEWIKPYSVRTYDNRGNQVSYCPLGGRK